jgi:DNA-directed RNA polymerase specialized sigma24 family protein
MIRDGIENISGGDEERANRCLQKCLDRLTETNRELIMQYYSLEREPKMVRRKELAQSLGISLSTLRFRVHRIRGSLEKCIASCLGTK